MAGDFYAKNSWDYNLVKPIIERYLEKNADEGDRYPHVISDTQIYDHIQALRVARFGANRLFHCISRVLKELGYERRSKRGRTWDFMSALNSRTYIPAGALGPKVQRRQPLSRIRPRRLGMRSNSSGFYPYVNEGRIDRIFQKSLDNNLITSQEEEDLRAYIAEYRATRHIKVHRVIKTTSDLVQWRRFLKVPYHDAKIQDIHIGISAMMAGTSLKGTPFADNTKHDYVKALRLYLFWMIESGRSKLTEKQVRKIKVPPKELRTTAPDEILSEEEIDRLINESSWSRDRALLALVYETGARIQEAHHLRWKDLVEDEDGVGVSIYDDKTRRIRHSRVISYREHIATWRKEHPQGKDLEAYVFVDKYHSQPLEYGAMRKVLSKARVKAGIKKRVHWHLLRKTRATHMIKQGYSLSVIKEMLWGNQDPRVLDTYCVISTQMIDDELNARAGVTKPREPEQIPTRPRRCPQCGFTNTPSSEWCGKCMSPLTDAARDYKEQLIQDVIRHWDVIPEAYRRRSEEPAGK